MQTNVDDLIVREIEVSEIDSILPLVAQQNPNVTPAQMAARLAEMRERGYRCIGAYMSDELAGIAGLWTGCRFWCGKYIDADNVVVAESHRNLGVGTKLMDWIHAEGRRLGCEVAVLDSYVTYVDAHRFYERLDYEKVGYHFVKKLCET